MIATILGIHPGNGHLSINNYYDNCLRMLPASLPDWRVLGIRPGEAGDACDPELTRVTRARGIFDNYVIWPIRLQRIESDVYHIVDQNLAWYQQCLRTGKVVITVHDLINVLLDKKILKFSRIDRWRAYHSRYNAGLLKRAHRIVSISRNTADDLVNHLGIPAAKIVVIPNANRSEFYRRTATQHAEARKIRYGSVEIALLHVGKPSSYKNRMMVLRTLDRITQMGRSARLVVTASELTSEEREFAILSGIESLIDVVIPRSAIELRELYWAADVMMFPSLYEGFGWPPIEAMASGCPVLASAGGSLLDVVSDGGRIVSRPDDLDSFVAELLNMTHSPKALAQWADAGWKNVQRFSPEVVVPQLADVYKSL